MSNNGQELRAPAGDILIRDVAIVSVDPAIGDVEAGHIVVRDGRIASIGAHPAPDGSYHETIDGRDMVAIPGFIDGHRHLWEGIVRNSLPDAQIGDYLREVNGGFAPAYTPDDAHAGTLVTALGAIDAGITGVFDWAHVQTSREHTDACLAALRDSGIRAVFGYGPPGSRGATAEWPDGLLRLARDEFAAKDQLLTLGLATMSPEHVPYEEAKRHFLLAREVDAVVSIHAGLRGLGTPDQIDRLGRDGLLDPKVNLVHCNTLSDAEWRAIADGGASVSITPSTEMQMGQGMPPILDALRYGVTTSIGVDVETSAPNDMWTQMRILFGLQRALAYERRDAGESDYPLMTAEQVLAMATRDGAAALGLSEQTGTLSPGKQADIVLLRCDLLNVMPVNDLKAAVVLNMDARNVDTVLVGGVIRKRAGRMLGVDLKTLEHRLYRQRDALFTRMGRARPCACRLRHV